MAFIIAGPGLQQLKGMTEKSESAPAPRRTRKGALVAALGAAGLMAAESAQAAEIMQVADDNRLALLAFPVVIALGWVAFK